MGQLINAVGHHTDRSSHQILRNLARARACGCNLQHKRAENAERRLYQTIHRKDPNNYLFQRATHRRSSPSRTALSTGSAATASRMRVKAGMVRRGAGPEADLLAVLAGNDTVQFRK